MFSLTVVVGNLSTITSLYILQRQWKNLYRPAGYKLLKIGLKSKGSDAFRGSMEVIVEENKWTVCV